jgi:hypothetical protein
MNAKFMADAEQEVEKEWAADTAFDVEEQRCREVGGVEEESDDNDWTGPDLEENAA